MWPPVQGEQSVPEEAGLVVGRMGGGWRGGSPAPFPCPMHSHPLWYLEAQPLLPLPPAPGRWRRWRRAPARTPGMARPRARPLSVQAMPCAEPCPLCFVQLSSASSIVPSGSLSLSSPSPHPILWPRLWFSGPCAPPLLPSGCAWVVPPRPVLITALFLIDLSYLGSVVETSLSSAQ